MGSPSINSITNALRSALARTSSLTGKLKAAAGAVNAINNLLSGGSKKPPAPPIAPPAAPEQDPHKPSRKKPRKTEDVDFGNDRTKRIRKTDPALNGEMIPVTSSNVHSIGFQADDPEEMRTRTGTLLIRYLGEHGGKRSGPGPLYGYFGVPIHVFQEFRRAASKGRFVWDDVRVRGTISGHQYAYQLMDIQGDHVPRQAGLKRGHDGEYFLRRRFMRDGKTLESQLPERKVRSSGPNRAAPNRGKPNNGRP